MRLIQEGNERVLAARLADAKFFFDEDRKIKLIDRVDKLKGVMFHQKLGTYLEKTLRIRDLATWLARKLFANSDQQNVCREAAEVSKADLLTGLVGEFPTLQGIMGAEYARCDGMFEEVSRAIRDQYLPRGMDGKLPETLPGRIISLADRLDSIVAFFYAGMIPKGSEDPYALRRDAISVVRIIVEGNLKLDLHEAVEEARSIAQASGIKEVSSMMYDPLNFIYERFRFYAGTVHQLRDDVVSAVCETAHQRTVLDLVDILNRMMALQAITRRKDFDPLIVGFKRAHRIVKKEEWDRYDVNTAQFQHNAETELHNVLRDVQNVVPTLIERGDYAAALNALVQMKPAIDGFFNGVLVNADDERLRANRLSLLCAVDRLFLSFADFSRISVQGT
jgi:glycyl-tRNA synthetase beta chain